MLKALLPLDLTITPFPAKPKSSICCPSTGCHTTDSSNTDSFTGPGGRQCQLRFSTNQGKRNRSLQGKASAAVVLLDERHFSHWIQKFNTSPTMGSLKNNTGIKFQQRLRNHCWEDMVPVMQTNTYVSLAHRLLATVRRMQLNKECLIWLFQQTAVCYQTASFVNDTFLVHMGEFFSGIHCALVEPVALWGRPMEGLSKRQRQAAAPLVQHPQISTLLCKNEVEKRAPKHNVAIQISIFDACAA